MTKAFLWIGIVALAAFVMKSQFLNSKTWEPFKQGCMAGGTATEEQCSCLSDYVHKHFSDQEVRMVMNQQLGDSVFKAKVEDVVRNGSQACAAE